MSGPDSTEPGAPGARPKRRPTPPGTWPVVVALGLLIVLAPITIALVAMPAWLAIAIAVAFAVGGTWALATSFVLLWRAWGTKGTGIPIIGCVLGAILVPVVLTVMVPLALAQ